jgi:hypothetical protein
MSSLLQDLTVSAIALGAAAAIVWRSVALFATKSGSPGCSSCASGCASRPATTRGRDDVERRIIRPVVIHATSSAVSRPRHGSRLA